MTWGERLYLALGIALAVLPFMVCLNLLVHRSRYMRLPQWRYRMAVGGLVLALIGAFPTPLFYFALQFPWRMKGGWLPLAAAGSMPVCLVAGLVAIVLLGFAQGRVRWMGIGSSVVSVGLLYVTLLGLSD